MVHDRYVCMPACLLITLQLIVAIGHRLRPQDKKDNLRMASWLIDKLGGKCLCLHTAGRLLCHLLRCTCSAFNVTLEWRLRSAEIFNALEKSL